MKKINYNVVYEKTPDTQKNIIKYGIIFFISLLFFITSLLLVKSRDNQLKKKREQKETIAKDIEAYKETIEKKKSLASILKKKYFPEINFYNSLILLKRGDMLGALNGLEDILPKEVFVTALSMEQKNKLIINVQLASYSIDKLIVAASLFPEQRLNIYTDNDNIELQKVEIKYVYKQ